MMTLDVEYWRAKHLHGRDRTRVYWDPQLGSKKLSDLNSSVQVTDMELYFCYTARKVKPVAFSKTPPKRSLLNLAFFITYAFECEVHSGIFQKR